MKRISLAIALVFIMIISMPVSAVDLNTAKQQKTSVDSRINKVQQDKQKALDTKAKLSDAKKDLTAVQTAESMEYDQMVGQLEQMQDAIDKINQSVTDAQDDYNQQSDLFKTRLKVMYEDSNVSILDMLISSRSLADFFERLQCLSLIAKTDKQTIDDLNQSKMDLEYKKQLQENTKQDLLGKVSNQKSRLTSLKNSRAELESQIRRNQAELDKLENEEDQLLEESNKLQAVIKNLSKSRKYAGGSMLWPVPSSHAIASTFGMRMHPILRKYKMHTGIDISAKEGQSIIAANSGTVIIAGYDKDGYGNYLVIDHGGGISTLYGHASKLLVGVGDKVKAGQVIAKVGMTGLATGPHCHFEVRVNGVPKNPFNGYVTQ